MNSSPMPLHHSNERISRIASHREELLRFAGEHECPLYVFDPAEAERNYTRFADAFSSRGVSPSVYFAVKSNSCLPLLKALVSFGAGLDVSSEPELDAALTAGARKMVYTGPAKTFSALEKVIAARRNITLHLDSFRELRAIEEISTRSERSELTCGVRVCGHAQQAWAKFGIELAALKDFLDESRARKVLVRGIQFHISYNRYPHRFVSTLRHLCRYAMSTLTAAQRESIEFIDIGGGFYPEVFEAMYKWNFPQRVRFSEREDFLKYVYKRSGKPPLLPVFTTPIEKFGEVISALWKSQVRKVFPRAELWAEPGRWISHSVLHFLMRVMDVRGDHTIVVDAGGNMVGWEKYQHYRYVPIFNLSRFSKRKEWPTLVYGSLCTPDDVWGYYVRGRARPREGDILVMPFQGAYTYSLAQNFIRSIPKVVSLTTPH